MIYVFIDPEREYLSVAAGLRKSGDEFKLIKTEDSSVKRDATAFWSTNDVIIETWGKVDKYDPDLPKPSKRRAKDGAKTSGDGDGSVS